MSVQQRIVSVAEIKTVANNKLVIKIKYSKTDKRIRSVEILLGRSEQIVSVESKRHIVPDNGRTDFYFTVKQAAVEHFPIKSNGQPRIGI